MNSSRRRRESEGNVLAEAWGRGSRIIQIALELGLQPQISRAQSLRAIQHEIRRLASERADGKIIPTGDIFSELAN